MVKNHGVSTLPSENRPTSDVGVNDLMIVYMIGDAQLH